MKMVRRCPQCFSYTMKPGCPGCGTATASPDPPRYSPQDRWGKYRRALIEEVRGGNDG